MPAKIRTYTAADRAAVRTIYGMDEFARPELLKKHPRFSEYLADDMSYYPDYEPESLFVAEVEGNVVGALLGAVDTKRFEQVYHHRIRPRLIIRGLIGAYGWPGWLPAILYTEWAERAVMFPNVDRCRYPAHLHIGILPEWRRQGIGTELINQFTEYLRKNGVPGYHLYASSYHFEGVDFYNKLGLELLGHFEWHLHTGFAWENVTERIYAKEVG